MEKKVERCTENRSKGFDANNALRRLLKRSLFHFTLYSMILQLIIKNSFQLILKGMRVVYIRRLINFLFPRSRQSEPTF